MGNEDQGYFTAAYNVTEALTDALDLVGTRITERQRIYHRGTFYADVAAVIRSFLATNLSPFAESAYNWAWWAGECEKRAAALGSDAQFAMHLPEPVSPGDYLIYPKITNQLDKMVSLMIGVYQQELDDNDITDLGKVTPAECAKITHRFVQYWLAPRCGELQRGYMVPWPWIAKVVNELKAVYRSMGEVDRAGSTATPGGPIPPISWPDP